jgi:hypothetical protein
MIEEDIMLEYRRLLEDLISRVFEEGLLTGNSEMTINKHDSRFEAKTGGF